MHSAAFQTNVTKFALYCARFIQRRQITRIVWMELHGVSSDGDTAMEKNDHSSFAFKLHFSMYCGHSS